VNQIPFKVIRFTSFSNTICQSVKMNLQAYSQNSERDAMLLNDLDVFRNPDKNWILVSDISTDYIQTRFKKYNQGKGTLLALKPGRELQTKNEFGDIELDFDFMPAGKASSGLLLQGRYMIQLADSWAKPHPLISDMGGVSWTQGAG